MSNPTASGKRTSVERTEPVDRRKQTRVLCTGFAEVAVEDGGYLYRGAIKDLSLGGCYITSTVRFPLRNGLEAELRFAVEGDELILPSFVRMVRPGGGAGFEFQEMAPEIRKRLAGMVNRVNMRKRRT